MNMTMIAAVGKNLELGKDNKLIWHFKEDMSFFKNETMGKPIIMGMKTYDSLPGLLPGRQHIVLTRRNIELDPIVLVVHSIDELLERIKEYPEVYVIGGASVYKELIDYSNKMILTEIDAESEADAYFPEFNKEDWESKTIGEYEENNISYKRLVYTRKKVR